MIKAKGKTKIIHTTEEKNIVVLETLDVLTGGDAAKYETIPGIGVLKTHQAINVFNLLSSQGIPTSFIAKHSGNGLLCHDCEMLPLEFVVRRYAWGSYLYRHPKSNGEKPERFSNPVWEIFHKWAVVRRDYQPPVQMPETDARAMYLNEGVWANGIYTDPYIAVGADTWELLPAKKPIRERDVLMEVAPLLHREKLQNLIEHIVVPAFRCIEDAWSRVETKDGPVVLADFKLEIGCRLSDGVLVIADVIDNDSWRIWPGGEPKRQLDKQCFRDNDHLAKVSDNYQLVTILTDEFDKLHK